MGLREQKKQKTREAIAHCATGMFIDRGFDHVRVSEVAEAAGVSEKTVFNYFPTKEDLFFDEAPEREAAFLGAIRDREPGETVVAALRRKQLTDCQRLASPGFAAWARVIEDSPALQAKELAIMAHLQQAVAVTLHDEVGIDELEARVAATLLVGVHWQFFRLARERALAGKHGAAAARRLRAELESAYELLENGLGNLKGRRAAG